METLINPPSTTSPVKIENFAALPNDCAAVSIEFASEIGASQLLLPKGPAGSVMVLLSSA